MGRATGVESVAAPEADATRALYERYGNQIFGYCLHQLGSREEAEDAVQSTFLNAFRGLSRGVVPEAEQAWLFKIAQNVCLSRRRSTWRRGRIESPADFEVAEETTAAPARRADELIGLQDVLENMPENQRRAILLREWQGLSYREIAEELELSQAAVETLIFRARRALAQGLEASPAEQRSWRARLRPSLDLGSLAGWVQSLLGSGVAVKAAGTVAIVAIGSAVVAPEARQLHSHPHAAPAAPAAPKRTSPAAASPSLHAVAASSVAVPASPQVPVRAARAVHLRARPDASPKVSAPPVSQPLPAAPPPADSTASSQPASVEPAAPPAARRDRSGGGAAETKNRGHGRDEQQPRHDRRAGTHGDSADRGAKSGAPQAKTPTGQAKTHAGKKDADGQSPTQTPQGGGNGKDKKQSGQAAATAESGTPPAQGSGPANANGNGSASGNGNGNGHENDAPPAPDPAASAGSPPAAAGSGNAGNGNGNGHSK